MCGPETWGEVTITLKEGHPVLIRTTTQERVEDNPCGSSKLCRREKTQDSFLFADDSQNHTVREYSPYRNLSGVSVRFPKCLKRLINCRSQVTNPRG